MPKLVHHSLQGHLANGGFESTSSNSLNSSNGLTSCSSASKFSSCSVPLMPPYGSATTTAASGTQYQSNSVTLTTLAPTCSSLQQVDKTSSNQFINLNTPIASSSRSSQINELLQHNRNTTVELVAVSEKAGTSKDELLMPTLSNTTASIDTPPIEEASKACLTYNEISAPLQTSIVGVGIDDLKKTPTNKMSYPVLAEPAASKASNCSSTTATGSLSSKTNI